MMDQDKEEELDVKINKLKLNYINLLDIFFKFNLI